MNARHVSLGMGLVILFSSWCYFNDHVVRAGELAGDLMPVVLYGGLVFVLSLMHLAGRFSGSGRAVPAACIGTAVVCLLFASGIPGRFTQVMPASVMCPHHDVRVHPGWAEQGVLDFIPECFRPDLSRDNGEALNGFITGLGEGDRHISLSRVPWGVWRRPLSFFTSLMVAVTLASLGLAFVFHHQWSKNEQLPYPISVFTQALIADDDQNGGRLLRNRLFWLGFVPVLLIGLNNYACRWYPRVLIPVSLRFDFSALAPVLEIFVKGKGLGLFAPRIVFPILGLSYFLASDVSIAMAVGPWVYCLIAGLFMAYGIELRTGREMALSIESFLYAGGYVGILLVLLYNGRHFYVRVLRSAFSRGDAGEIPRSAVAGLRLAIVAFAVAVALLFSAGVPLALSVVYLCLVLMVYIVVSRIIAETGCFRLGTFVFPGVVLWGFLGTAYLGPQQMVPLFMVSTVLCLIPARAPMAFAVQALKYLDLSRSDIRPWLGRSTVVILLSFLVAVPTALYWQYDRGTPNYGWPRKAVTFPFENAVEAAHELKAQGRYEDAVGLAGIDRLRLVSPRWGHVSAFAIAAVLALGFAAGRLRFRRWPLHPVVFLFLGGHAAISMSFSFFLGWFLKTLITRYGGASLYNRCKPLMIGLIAGAMLGQFVPFLIGSARYFATGQASV